MSDVCCAKCGEPWDSYSLQPGVYMNGNGDLTREEAEAFRRGEGCPCCRYGTVCPTCGGTGIDTLARGYGFKCDDCNHTGKWRLWKPLHGTQWYEGYSPKTKNVPTDVAEKAMGDLKPTRHLSRDGPYLEIWVVCPSCKDRQPKCEACKGTGDLPKPSEDLELRAAREDCSGSDEDPVAILARRGII